MNKVQRDFIWGTTDEKRKLHLLNWDTITNRKIMGGLGIQKSEIKNRVILSSLVWRVAQNPNRLWSKVLTSKYCKSNTSSNSIIVSRTWKNIQNGWIDITKATKWIVHKGNKVNFLSDNWLPHHDTLRSVIQGSMAYGEENIEVSKIYHQGNWDFDKISFELPGNIKTIIKSYLFPQESTKEDKLVWGLKSNGLFSTSSAYNHIKEETSKHFRKPNEKLKWIWNANAPNRIKTFLWLLYHRRLPTNHSLQQKEINVNPKCHYCDYPRKDSNYIFFYCQKSLNLWNSIQARSSNQGSPITDIINETNWIDEWNKLRGKQFNQWLDWNTLIPFCLWNIWITGNNNTFNDQKNSISSHQTISQINEYSLLIGKQGNTKARKTTMIVKEEPPNPGSYKLNVDASVKHIPGPWGI
ncbi:hypothetical protein KY290_006805 [Solanum tuberosum]|uniref:Reverse transcriptase zinc-binding domain-containing protein n=1 Tax=Solanum tuberosum TaxID=4113 RepID=A0ABQ7WI51_SOLTU|nr:hypothetical protein KY290_006805 [Solanum tuberosum]